MPPKAESSSSATTPATPAWGPQQQRLLIHAMLTHGISDRPRIYRTPGLEPWAGHGGDRINARIKIAVREICKALGVAQLEIGGAKAKVKEASQAKKRQKDSPDGGDAKKEQKSK